MSAVATILYALADNLSLARDLAIALLAAIVIGSIWLYVELVDPA